MVAALLVLVAFGVVVLLVLGIMLLVLLEVVGTRADKSDDRFEKKIRQIALVIFLDHLRRHAKGILFRKSFSVRKTWLKIENLCGSFCDFQKCSFEYIATQSTILPNLQGVSRHWTSGNLAMSWALY